MKLKRIFLLFFITTTVIYSGCKKAPNITLDNQIKNPFFDSAVQFLKTKLSNDDYAKLDLTSNKILRYRNKNIGIQIFEKEASEGKFLLLEIESGNYNGNWVDLSALKKIGLRYQSGSITLESLDKGINTKFIVDSNEVIQIIKSGDNLPGSITLNPGQRNPQVERPSGLNNVLKDDVLPEVIVYYDVNASIDYTASLYWLFNEQDSYGDLYFEPGSGAGAPGTVGNQTVVTVAPTIISPVTPISDLKQDLKCFTNNSSSTYSIAVNVNEPDPDFRDVYEPASSFPVGHTYVTLQQHNSDGSIITRNVGFYPKNSVKPGASVDRSIFGDDSYTPFAVSLEVKVTGPDFNTVLNTLINQQAYNYDIDNFNCTNSPIDALQSIDINLPDTKSAGILFTGNDPADLGEDIRSLNLDNFSAANGNRQFKRSVSNSNDQEPPAREGTCP